MPTSWIRGSRARARPLLGAALLLLACGAPAVAHAQAGSGDAALAQTLFDEGRRLMAASDFAAACPKLAESYRLDAGSGTLTALAVCHESLGRTASAWTEFIEVVSEARQAGRADRERFAQQHIGALEPKLSRLKIVIDPSLSSLPGLEVRRDGTILGAAGWGTAAPVDPGDHTVQVTATGKKTWSTQVTVGDNADVESVQVPALEDAPVEATTPGSAPEAAGESKEEPAPSTAETAHPGDTQRVVGIVLAGAGVIGLGIGAAFGAQAISKMNDANGGCPDSSHCADPTAVNASHDATSAAHVADIAFGAAAVAIVSGALVYFLAPSGPVAAPPSTEAPAALRFIPSVAMDRATMTVQLSF